MSLSGSLSRQCNGETWTLEQLCLEQACALGASLECSTIKTYASAFLSYSSFCQWHNFPIHPMANTLSFYTVYMCHFIWPSSIKSYLSSICAELESFWPDVCEIHKSYLVSKTLAGCMKLHGTAAHWKHALTQDDLVKILSSISTNPTHDCPVHCHCFTRFSHSLMWFGTFRRNRSMLGFLSLSSHHGGHPF